MDPFSGLFGSGEADDEEKIGEDNFDSIEMGDHFSPLDAIEQGTVPLYMYMYMYCTLYVHCTYMDNIQYVLVQYVYFNKHLQLKFYYHAVIAKGKFGDILN